MNDVNPLASAPNAAPSLRFTGTIRALDIVGVADVESGLFKACAHEVGAQAADGRCIDDVMNGTIDDVQFWNGQEELVQDNRWKAVD